MKYKILMKILAFTFLILPYSFAVFNCDIETTCSDSGEVKVFRVSDITNAHAGNMSSSYTNIVCCRGVSGLGTNCYGNWARVVRISSADNGHVQAPIYGYTVDDICISGPAAGVDCYVDTSCDTDYYCVVKLSADNNAHVAGCTDSTYTQSVCCRVPEAPASTSTTTSSSTTTTAPPSCPTLTLTPESGPISYSVTASVSYSSCNICDYLGCSGSSCAGVLIRTGSGTFTAPSVEGVYGYYSCPGSGYDTITVVAVSTTSTTSSTTTTAASTTTTTTSSSTTSTSASTTTTTSSTTTVGSSTTTTIGEEDIIINETYIYIQERMIIRTATGEPNFTKTMPIDFIVNAVIIGSGKKEKCGPGNCVAYYNIDGAAWTMMDWSDFAAAWREAPSSNTLACDMYHYLNINVSTIVSGTSSVKTGRFFVNCREKVTVNPLERFVALGTGEMTIFNVTIWNPTDNAKNYAVVMSEYGPTPGYVLSWIEFDGYESDSIVLNIPSISSGSALVKLTTAGKAGIYQIKFTATPGTGLEAIGTFAVTAESLYEFGLLHLLLLILLSVFIFSSIKK